MQQPLGGRSEGVIGAAWMPSRGQGTMLLDPSPLTSCVTWAGHVTMPSKTRDVGRKVLRTTAPDKHSTSVSYDSNGHYYSLDSLEEPDAYTNNLLNLRTHISSVLVWVTKENRLLRTKSANAFLSMLTPPENAPLLKSCLTSHLQTVTFYISLIPRLLIHWLP